MNEAEGLATYMNKRFGNEGINVRAREVNSADLILVSELDREDPVVIIYEKEHRLKVAWVRAVQLSDYQRNRFQFQLYHIVHDYEMRTRNLRRIQEQGG